MGNYCEHDVSEMADNVCLECHREEITRLSQEVEYLHGVIDRIDALVTLREWGIEWRRRASAGEKIFRGASDAAEKTVKFESGVKEQKDE